MSIALLVTTVVGHHSHWPSQLSTITLLIITIIGCHNCWPSRRPSPQSLTIVLPAIIVNVGGRSSQLIFIRRPTINMFFYNFFLIHTSTYSCINTYIYISNMKMYIYVILLVHKYTIFFPLFRHLTLVITKIESCLGYFF